MAYHKSLFPLAQCVCVIFFSLVEALIQNSILDKIKFCYSYEQSKKSDSGSDSEKDIKKDNNMDIFSSYDIIDALDDLDRITTPMIIFELLTLLFLGSTGKICLISMAIHLFSILFFLFHTRKTFSLFPQRYIFKDYANLRRRHILILISSIISMIYGLLLFFAELKYNYKIQIF